MYPSKPICSAPLFLQGLFIDRPPGKNHVSKPLATMLFFPHYSIERRAFDEKSQISLHIPHPTYHIPLNFPREESFALTAQARKLA
jgi:hypothetical protein